MPRAYDRLDVGSVSATENGRVRAGTLVQVRTGTSREQAIQGKDVTLRQKVDVPGGTRPPDRDLFNFSGKLLRRLGNAQG